MSESEHSDMLCPYCGRPVTCVRSAAIYGPGHPDYGWMWLCKPCWAYVGCHRDTKKPLGRIADAKLRKAKCAAHSAFDPIWRSKEMKRKDAYRWLAGELNIESGKCHIGMFDVELCERVIAACGRRQHGGTQQEEPRED